MSHLNHPQTPSLILLFFTKYKNEWKEKKTKKEISTKAKKK